MKPILWYTKKAKKWEEALPTGNGRIGAMTFGDLKKERIALNEDSLWSGYPKDLNKKGAYEHLDEIREAIFSGDRKLANEIATSKMNGHWSEAYLPFGDLVIEYKSKISKKGYKRSLDISKGVCHTRSNEFVETVFVSHPAQMLVVNIKSEKPISFDIKFESQLQNNTYTNQDSLVIEGNAPEICMPPYYNTGKVFEYGEKAMKFCGVAKILGNAKFETDRISVVDQNEITILVSLATSFVDFKSMPTANAVERAYSYLENTKSFDALLEEHKADFASLYDRVDVDFGSENTEMPTDKRIKAYQKHADLDQNLVALLFQYGRYLTITCSRAGTNASTLQGIYNQHLRAPWSSSYTTNINTEMNYWCTDICNLSECFEPFIELVKKLVENGVTTAKDYYNCNGTVAHHNVDIWGATYPAGDPLGETNSEAYAFWQSSLAWMLNEVFEHYRYISDKEQLKVLYEELKPCYEQALTFYKEFLVEHNGVLVTCPSLSPENTYIDKNGKRGCLTYMPTMDIGILEEFFHNCNALGLETPELPPIPIGSDGRINEWAEEFIETEIEHRHVSHLYCVYPSTIEQSEEVNKATEKSLLVRGFGGTGWSLGWKVCLWARLKNPENAMKLIKNQLRLIRTGKINYGGGGGSYPNLFDAHPPFQIDGNFGVTAGIAEMIKQGAVPKSWNGYAKGIKLYGGEILNVKFKDGLIEKID